MKAQLYSIIALLSLALLFPSCSKDFLEFDPEGKLPEEEFFVTEEHADQAVNAAYAHLRTWNQVAFAFYAIQEMPSDNAIKGSVVGDAAFMNDYVNLTVVPNEGQLGGYWSSRYKGVNLCNQVIDNIDETSTPEEKKVRLLAEVKFLRAFYYFDLVRAYGDIPLVTTTESAAGQAGVRAPKQEVYDQIIADLLEAEQGLPVSYPASEHGRATKGAAQTLLAKVYLYQENWSEAARLTDEVIATGPYELMDDFWGMFRVENENCIESVFEIQAPYDPADWNLTNCQYAEPQGPRDVYGWGFNAPTDNLAAAFDEAGDTLRKNATIIYFGKVTPNGDRIEGIGINQMEGVEVPRYNGKAYSTQDERDELGQWSSWGQNVRAIRYAETLLINAEAHVRQGNISEGAESLNEVRDRAHLDPITNPTVEDVLKERRLELAMEGDRFFDLVRTEKAATVLAYKGFITGIHEVFPIPQDIIDMTDGTIVQNFGY